MSIWIRFLSKFSCQQVQQRISCRSVVCSNFFPQKSGVLSCLPSSSSSTSGAQRYGCPRSRSLMYEILEEGEHVVAGTGKDINDDQSSQ